MNNAAYGKTMENLRSRIDVKLVNNEEDYLKRTSEPSFMSNKIFDNNLVAIRKSKVSLKVNKPAYIRMCILELHKVLMYEFHYDYIKNKYDNTNQKYYSQTLIIQCMKLKLKMFMKILAAIKKCLILVIIRVKQNYDDSNKLVIGKMKDETGGVAIAEFVGLKTKMYSLLEDDNKKYKKTKGVNRYVVATIGHNKFRDILLNNKCIRHTIEFKVKAIK